MTHQDGSYVEYAYDAALRLTSEQRFSAGGTLVSETAYTYDRDGNRLTVVRDGATDIYAYGTGERLVSGGSSARAMRPVHRSRPMSGVT